MGEAIRLKLPHAMKAAAQKHAKALSASVSHKVSLAGAIRDLLARALDGTTADAGYNSGFVQGFMAGYSDGKEKGFARARGITGAEQQDGRIRPPPSRDNADYRGEPEDDER
jgi:hypothetical protein